MLHFSFGEIRCKRCGSTAVGRSKRKHMFERSVLSAFGLLPYRCHWCSQRFYARAEKHHGQALPVTPPAHQITGSAAHQH